MRSLDVWMYGQKVGTVTQSSNGYTLEYEQSWKDNPNAVPLSLSLPMQANKHASNKVRNFLGGVTLTNA